MKPRNLAVAVLFVSLWVLQIFLFSTHRGDGPGQGFKQRWESFRRRLAISNTTKPCTSKQPNEKPSVGGNEPSGAHLQALLVALLDQLGMDKREVFAQINKLDTKPINLRTSTASDSTTEQILRSKEGNLSQQQERPNNIADAQRPSAPDQPGPSAQVIATQMESAGVKQPQVLNPAPPPPPPVLVDTKSSASDNPHSANLPPPSQPSSAPTLHDDPGPDPSGRFQEEVWRYPHSVVKDLALNKIRAPRMVEAGKAYTEWSRRRFEKAGGRTWVGMTVKPGKNPAEIKRIWVWGERNSCTTVVTDILAKNFEKSMSCEDKPCVKGGMPWKHMHMRDADTYQQASTLHILVTRDPLAWVKSMHSHPFYAAFHEGLGMEDFVSLEWVSFRESPEGAIAKGNRVKEALPRAPDPPPPPPPPAVRPCVGGAGRGERCMHKGRSYGCTLVPGLELVKEGAWPLGEECLAPSAGGAECGAEELLCREGAELPWVMRMQDWKRTLARRLHDQNPPPQGTAEGNRKASGRCATVIGKGGMGGVASGQCQKLLAGYRPGASAPVYACTEAPGYKVGHGDELPPSNTCLAGAETWSICSKGHFFCEVGAAQLWDTDKPRWQRVSSALKALMAVHKSSPRAPALKWEVLQDRDQDTSHRFPSVLALRASKLRDWFLVAKDLDFTAHLPCRDFFLDAQSMVDELVSKFKLRPAGGKVSLSSCVYTFGNCQAGSEVAWDDPKQKSKRDAYLAGEFIPRAFTPSTLETIAAWSDPELEAALGYQAFAEMAKAATPYNRETRCNLHVPASVRTSAPWLCPA